MKPMLAAKTDGTNLRYPLLASPKLDGVRALVIDGRVYSRTLKLIPNPRVQELFGKEKYNGLDGELIAGSPTDPGCFRATTSAVMSKAPPPRDDISFFAFDYAGHPRAPFDAPFRDRLIRVAQTARGKRIWPVAHAIIPSVESLLKYEEDRLSEGHEGVMLRHPDGPYKHGRSTEKEGWLLKLKRFEDSEAIVLSCAEQMHNGNEPTLDELGRTKRSSHKANKTGKGTLGALHVRDISSGVEFDIGTGFDDDLRSTLWHQRDTLAGRVVKYKFFPTGSKEKPRFPVFLGFRDARDM